MNERTGKLIAAGMVLFVGCPCLGFAAMLAMSLDEPEPPRVAVAAAPAVPWALRLAECARDPATVGRLIESGSLTDSYDCAPGTLYVTRARPAEWRYDAPTAPVSESFGARLLARESKTFEIVTWYRVDGGPIAGAFLRYKTSRQSGALELQVMNAAHVAGNPYGMTVPDEVAAETR